MKDPVFPRHVNQVRGPQQYDDPRFQLQLKELLKIPIKQVRLENLFPGIDSGVVEKYLRKLNEENTAMWKLFLAAAQKKYATPQQLFNALALSGPLGF